MKELKKLEKMEWDYSTNDLFTSYDELGYEEDLLEKISNSYSDGYIGDCIMEVANNFIPIYTHELWENAKDLREWIERAIDEFGTGKEVDLEQLFKQGYYLYFTELMYQNWDAIVWNYTVNYIDDNDLQNRLTEENFEDIEYHIESDIESFEDISSFIDNLAFYKD